MDNSTSQIISKEDTENSWRDLKLKILSAKTCKQINQETKTAQHTEKTDATNV